MVLPLDASEISNLAAGKESPGTGINAKSNGQSGNKSFITPSIVPGNNPASGKESITFSRTKPGMLLKPAHVRRPSVNKFEVEKLSAAVESGTLSNIKSGLDSAMGLNSQARLVSEDGARKSCDEKDSNIKSVTEKSDKMLSPQIPSNQETCKFYCTPCYHFFLSQLWLFICMLFCFPYRLSCDLCGIFIYSYS